MKNYNLIPFTNLDEIYPMIDKISLLGGLNNEELYELFSVSEYGVFKKNDILFHKDDSPNYIYIVLSGQIKVYMTKDNIDYEFINISIGDCLGEASLMSIEPHTATAVCAKKTKLILISRKTLFTLHKTKPTLFSKLILNIARELARRLHKNNNLLFQYISTVNSKDD